MLPFPGVASAHVRPRIGGWLCTAGSGAAGIICKTDSASAVDLYPRFRVATPSIAGFYGDDHLTPPGGDIHAGFSGTRERDVLLAPPAQWPFSAGSRLFRMAAACDTGVCFASMSQLRRPVFKL